MDIVSKAEEQKEELVKRVEVEDTPFTIVRVDGLWFGTMGEYRLTEQFENFADCQDAVSKFSWNRVVQVMMLLVDKLKAVDLDELIKDKK